jgi:hypothetical protein
MGLFGNIFHKIGGGLTSFGKTIGHGLHQVLNPVYKSVVKPVGQSIGRIFKKTTDASERIVSDGLDFSQRFVGRAQKGALNLEEGALNLTSFLKNPLILIGGGLVVLTIVTR